MVTLRASVVALGMLLSAALPVAAQDFTSALPSAGVLDIVDEVRIGGNFHDVYYTMIPQNFGEWDTSRFEDVSFDILFTSPDMDAFRWIGSPRPELGTTLNLRGQDSLFHAGLTWQLPVFDTPFYLEGTFGAALNTGYLDNAPAGRNNFGCRVNFYERFGVGANLSESVTATLTYEHTSNADLCDENDGLSNFGLRVGMKF